MYGVFGSNTIALAAIAARMIILLIVSVTDSALRFAGVHHEYLLHFAIVKVIQLTYRRLGACNQLEENGLRAWTRHIRMLQQFGR